MILDSQNLFCEGQVVSATANATNDIDLGPIAAANPGRDLGASSDCLFLQVQSAAAGTGAGTIQVSLVTDNNSAFSSPITLWSSPAIVGTALAAGATLGSLHIPSTTEKYLRVVFTVTGTATGTFNAFLTPTPQDNVSYAPGFNFPAGA